MRSYLFLSLLPVLVVGAAAPPSVKPEDLGQVTLTMHATISCRTHYVTKDKTGTDDDDLTVTINECDQYRVTRILNALVEWDDLETISRQDSFIASGGGTATYSPPPGTPKSPPRTWTYHMKEHSPFSHIRVKVNLKTGRGQFYWSFDESWLSNQELEENEHKGWTDHAAMIASGALDDLRAGRSTIAGAFFKQLEFSFEPYSKNLSVHRSADYTYQSDDPEYRLIGPAVIHADFSLSTGVVVEAEAEIIPSSAYASWVPEAGEDEQKPGNTITVRARVYKKGDPTKSSGKNACFKFQLVDVSKEKGVCLNWPEASDSTDGFDLKIEAKSNDSLKVAKDGQSAESAAGLNESNVTITSHDWGAYGKLRVTVVFDDGSTVEAHVPGDPSIHELTLPKDDNGNHIADVWEKLYPIGSFEAQADDDVNPKGDNSPGDGLSLYEEYRGFVVQGRHLRTSPVEKDLFVRDDNHLGLGYFVQSLLTVHLIESIECLAEDGATNPWVINYNRGFATRGQQHLLYMRPATLEGLYGLADGTGPGVPKTTKAVKIDVASCLTIGARQLQSTIAHELSHGCNVWHHGDSDYPVTEVEGLMPNGTWVKYTSVAPWTVSIKGGQESGVEQCIMRYSLSSYYENSMGTWRWKKPPKGALQLGKPYAPGEDPGIVFCDDAKGTGVNGNADLGSSKAGNATKGNCKGQFCVNDSRH
jgi:hypothetical protein